MNKQNKKDRLGLLSEITLPSPCETHGCHLLPSLSSSLPSPLCEPLQPPRQQPTTLTPTNSNRRTYLLPPGSSNNCDFSPLKSKISCVFLHPNNSYGCLHRHQGHRSVLTLLRHHHYIKHLSSHPSFSSSPIVCLSSLLLVIFLVSN